MEEQASIAGNASIDNSGTIVFHLQHDVFASRHFSGFVVWPCYAAFGFNRAIKNLPFFASVFVVTIPFSGISRSALCWILCEEQFDFSGTCFSFSGLGSLDEPFA